jgi:fumarylacetoacetase
MREATMRVPADVGDYSDFYASVFHATNVGSMFRPDNPLLPNYKWVPIGYHGRASSVIAGGSPVRRPSGQPKAPSADRPAFGPSRQLDYELEVGAWIGGENRLGEPVPLSEAERRIFGVTLLNDWSARDLQSWEYQPLGPFLAKSFATSVSPWVVTLEALAPFRVPAFTRPAGDPDPMPYLDDPGDRAAGGLSITLEVALLTARMREEGRKPARLSRTNFRQMYWTFAQMLTHHASNGCNLRPGDLIGSGTVSGPTKEERGCLLELSWRGTDPVALPDGEFRTFLEQGDEVVMTGWCEAEGAVRIGLGECRGVVE